MTLIFVDKLRLDQRDHYYLREGVLFDSVLDVLWIGIK